MIIEKLEQLPGREKVGLAVALILIVLYVADLSVIKPFVRRLRELDLSVEVQQKLLDHHLKVLSYEASVASQYEGVKDLIGVSGTEQESIEAFKNEIDELALRNAVSLRTMRHLTPEKTAFLATYIIEVSEFEAEISALINFMHAISRSPGLIRVRNVGISSQGTDRKVSGSLVVTKVMTQGTEGVGL